MGIDTKTYWLHWLFPEKCTLLTWNSHNQLVSSLSILALICSWRICFCKWGCVFYCNVIPTPLAIFSLFMKISFIYSLAITKISLEIVLYIYIILKEETFSEWQTLIFVLSVDKMNFIIIFYIVTKCCLYRIIIFPMNVCNIDKASN
jgi:hypothetical protein